MNHCIIPKWQVNTYICPECCFCSERQFKLPVHAWHCFCLLRIKTLFGLSKVWMKVETDLGEQIWMPINCDASTNMFHAHFRIARNLHVSRRTTHVTSFAGKQKYMYYRKRCCTSMCVVCARRWKINIPTEKDKVHADYLLMRCVGVLPWRNYGKQT